MTAGRVAVHESPDDAAIDREVWVYQGTAGRSCGPPASLRVQRGADAISGRPGAFADDLARRTCGCTASRRSDRGRPVGSLVVGRVAGRIRPDRRRRARWGPLALGAPPPRARRGPDLGRNRPRAAPGARDDPARLRTGAAHDHERRFGPGPRPDELGELAGTFDALLDRLAASLRHEQRLSAELSHELRTPLARIVAEAELLRSRRALGGRDRGEAYAFDRAQHRRDEGDPRHAHEGRARRCRPRSRADASSGRCWSASLPAGRPALEARGIELEIGASTGIDVGVDAEVAERILTPILHNAERLARARVVLSAEVAETGVLVHRRRRRPGHPRGAAR